MGAEAHAEYNDQFGVDVGTSQPEWGANAKPNTAPHWNTPLSMAQFRPTQVHA